MEQCPMCDGKGSYEISIDEPWRDNAEPVETTCYVCKGSGKLTRLALAVYKARERG